MGIRAAFNRTSPPALTPRHPSVTQPGHNAALLLAARSARMCRLACGCLMLVLSLPLVYGQAPPPAKPKAAAAKPKAVPVKPPAVPAKPPEPVSPWQMRRPALGNSEFAVSLPSELKLEPPDPAEPKDENARGKFGDLVFRVSLTKEPTIKDLKSIPGAWITDSEKRMAAIPGLTGLVSMRRRFKIGSLPAAVSMATYRGPDQVWSHLCHLYVSSDGALHQLVMSAPVTAGTSDFARMLDSVRLGPASDPNPAAPDYSFRENGFWEAYEIPDCSCTMLLPAPPIVSPTEKPVEGVAKETIGQFVLADGIAFMTHRTFADTMPIFPPKQLVTEQLERSLAKHQATGVKVLTEEANRFKDDPWAIKTVEFQQPGLATQRATVVAYAFQHYAWSLEIVGTQALVNASADRIVDGFKLGHDPVKLYHDSADDPPPPPKPKPALSYEDSIFSADNPAWTSWESISGAKDYSLKVRHHIVSGDIVNHKVTYWTAVQFWNASTERIAYDVTIRLPNGESRFVLVELGPHEKANAKLLAETISGFQASPHGK